MNDKNEILDVIPEGYSYVVLPNHEVRANIFDKESAEKWLKEYDTSTGTQWRVQKTFPNLGSHVIFKKVFRCHMNTRASEASSKTTKPHEKHTNCKATLTITVKNPSMPWSNDKYLEEHPSSILLPKEHNHSTKCADALRHRRPNADIREKFIQLFAAQHSPSSALDVHKYDLQVEHGNDYYLFASDGAVCPSQKWCYRLFQEVFKKEYGDHNGPAMIESLTKVVNKYNEDCKSVCAKVDFDPKQPRDLAVVIVSPLMKSIHRYLRSSGETVFIDSSGNMDRHNTRVFKFTTPSVAGALPLGILLTFSESQSVLDRGFRLLKSILPEYSFYNEGIEGPKIFMTDGCDSLRNALRSNFSNSTLLLCKFHILQAYWRYLWNAENKVQKLDRTPLFKEFQKVLNSETEDVFQNAYSNALENITATKYPTVVSYLTKLKKSAEAWAMCYRSRMLTRGHETNNYAEADFRATIEKVFCRSRAFSVVQTFDFLTTRYSACGGFCPSAKRLNLEYLINSIASALNCNRYKRPG